MNNEIKEILEYLNKHKEGLKDKTYYPEDLLSCKDLLLLLDYITNLEKEKERLKQDLSYYQGYGADMLHKNNGLEERIEKAVEYIKSKKRTITKYEAEDTRLPIDTFMYGVDNLLNILNGRREVIIAIDENAIQELKSYVYKSEMYDELRTELLIRNNNWNELKEFIENELNSNVDKEKSFGGYQCKIILDKIKELEK